MLYILFKNTYFLLFFLLFSSFISCSQSKNQNLPKRIAIKNSEIITGAQQTEAFLPLLLNKNVAVVANQTSVIYTKNGKLIHLIDTLLKNNILVTNVFAPEHGFRGIADASELIDDGFDKKTGLPIISLYGKNKKPTKEQLKNIDIVVFDIQDVGVRFYTYISTLHYVMEACAENNIPLIVLDRPNPNGHYVDGPMLELNFKSFVGMHPVPVVYGLTIGEYAQMINNEGWLKNKIKAKMTVIPLQNYTHKSTYSLPVRPSPNLPNDLAINLYPSLGFFEGTTINAGRGTDKQFQQYGAPFFPVSNFTYTPKPNFGSKYPKHNGELCYGVDLKNETKQKSINLTWLIDAYKKIPKSEKFFGPTFTIHAGSPQLEHQLKAGLSADEIRKSWQPDVEAFKKVRKKYLMYKD